MWFWHRLMQSQAQPDKMPRLLVVVTGKGPQRAGYLARLRTMDLRCGQSLRNRQADAGLPAVRIVAVIDAPAAACCPLSGTAECLCTISLRCGCISEDAIAAQPAPLLPLLLLPSASTAADLACLAHGSIAQHHHVHRAPLKGAPCLFSKAHVHSTCVVPGDARSGRRGWRQRTTRSCWVPPTWASACTPPPLA